MSLHVAAAPAADLEVITTRSDSTETPAAPAPADPERYRYTVRRRLAEQTDPAEASGAA